MSGSTALGVSASDAVTDALLEDGERPEGRTEWEEALIRHRIIDAPPAPPASADEELLDLPDASTGRAEALSQLSAEQLEEREDEGEDEERRMLQHYRRRRLAELAASARRAAFGQVREVRGSDFVVEVTAASTSHAVVVHLYSPLQRSCRTVSHHLRSLAHRFPHTKFVEVVAQEAIPNYPTHRTPTLLVYHTGEMQAQVVGIDAMGGADGCTAERIEWRLKEAKAIEGSPLVVDPFSYANRTRMQLRRGPRASRGRGGEGGGAQRHDDDDDGDDNDDGSDEDDT